MVNWLKKLSWDVYLIIFYICIFLVFLVIIDFLYVAISYKHRKINFMQPVILLRLALYLSVTILYIPFTGKPTIPYITQCFRVVLFDIGV